MDGAFDQAFMSTSFMGSMIACRAGPFRWPFLCKSACRIWDWELVKEDRMQQNHLAVLESRAQFGFVRLRASESEPQTPRATREVSVTESLSRSSRISLTGNQLVAVAFGRRRARRPVPSLFCLLIPSSSLVVRRRGAAPAVRTAQCAPPRCTSVTSRLFCFARWWCTALVSWW